MLSDRILFIDAEAIVIDKPAGLPVDTPRRGGEVIASRLDELRCGFKRPPTPMHRLDQRYQRLPAARAHRPRRAPRFQQAFEARRGRKILSGGGRRRDGGGARGRSTCRWPRHRAPRPAGGWSAIRGPGGDHALAADCGSRWPHPGRIPAADRPHAPNSRPRARGVRQRHRRRPRLRHSRRADAAPRLAAGRAARRASRRST